MQKKAYHCKENENIRAKQISSQHKQFKKMLKTGNNCKKTQISAKMVTLGSRGVLKSKPASNMIDLESAPIAVI